MDQSLLRNLLDEYLTGSLTDQERAQLSDLLRQPDYRRALEEILTAEFSARVYEGAGHDEILSRIDAHVRRNLHSAKPAIHIAWRRWVAAAVILLLVGTWMLIKKDRSTKPEIAAVQPEILPGGNKAVLTLADGSKITLDTATKGTIADQGHSRVIKTDSGKIIYAVNDKPSAETGMNMLTTPRGGMYQVTLPDGTKVWLNAASSISYPASFVGSRRDVHITGEAYFEVAKDKSKPFHVMANDIDVVVLGTHFNINAYADEPDMKTTLLEGSIKLSAGKYTTMLKPGEQAQLGRNGKVNILQHEDMEQVMAWKTGFFNFRNADLPTVMRQLERWYNIDVTYDGDIPKRRFQGELPRTLPLSKILIVLNEMKIRYKQEGKMITIRN